MKRYRKLKARAGSRHKSTGNGHRPPTPKKSTPSTPIPSRPVGKPTLIVLPGGRK